MHCEQKGFVESFTMRDGKHRPILNQCSYCRDTQSYSDEVRRRTAQKPPEPEAPKVKPPGWVAPVIPIPVVFRRG